MRDKVVAQLVAERLRGLRDVRKTSLREIAKKSGLRVEVVSRLLRGKHTPSVASLARLCSGLGVSFSEFFADAKLVAVTAATDPGTPKRAATIEPEEIAVRLQRLLDPLSQEARHLVVSALETLARGYTPPRRETSAARALVVERKSKRGGRRPSR